MNFEHQFKYFLILFQVCDLDSQALTQHTELVALLHAWNYFLIVVVIGAMAAIYCLSDAIFSDIDPIGKLTDIVQVCTPLVTYFVLLVEAVL